MQQELDKNPELAKYFPIAENEAGEWIINIDWEEIDKITDEEEGQKLEDALSNIEDWVKDINDANETLNDIEDTVQDIYERGKDEYFDFES
jgi:exonuclease VII small subunit